MRILVRAAGGASLYLLGAASGFALVIPLAASALSANAGAPVTPVSGVYRPALTYQSQMVNRAAKGSRLDIRTPAAAENSTMVAKSAGASASRATSENGAPAVSQPIRIVPAGPSQTTPARATPKGCLSAIGATRSNLATDELTVCVADAALIRSIE